MDSQLKKGLLDILVLATLNKGDSYGYKVIQDLSIIHALSESTLYPILKRLESQNALKSYSAEHSGRLRKYYTITKIGAEKLLAFKQEWKQIKQIYDFIDN